MLPSCRTCATSHMVPPWYRGQGLKGSFHAELNLACSRGASDARDRICSDLKFIRVKSVPPRPFARCGQGRRKGPRLVVKLNRKKSLQIIIELPVAVARCSAESSRLQITRLLPPPVNRVSEIDITHLALSSHCAIHFNALFVSPRFSFQI
jgi:hypothetical protein